MSSTFVREAIYTAIPLLLPDLAFVPTLNVPVDKTVFPDLWFTVDFAALERPRTALGSPGCYLERGVILADMYSKPDVGDIPLAQMGDEISAAFLDWTDPTGALRIYQVNPPTEVDGGDMRGAWWVMQLSLDYNYRTD
jgi:hypothetical protein